MTGVSAEGIADRSKVASGRTVERNVSSGSGGAGLGIVTQEDRLGSMSRRIEEGLGVCYDSRTLGEQVGGLYEFCWGFGFGNGFSIAVKVWKGSSRGNRRGRFRSEE